MNAITLGNPNLFVKGIAEVVITDPTTGNIIGYDNVASEGAVSTSVNMGEITGGVGNPVLMTIPDSTRITGELTSQAFSMQQRALATGGSVLSNGVVSYCETVTTDNTGVLTATMTPVKAYGQPTSDTNCWCYVRVHGSATYQGTNIGIDPTTKKTPASAGLTPNTQYDLFYFVSMATAKVLALPDSFNPSIATVRIKYCVYAKQNNSVSNGTLQGYLYFVVPRAQFTGDAGIGANQTNNATTSYSWMALTPDRNMIECNACGETGSDYAYYVYAPCNTTIDDQVESIFFVGGAKFMLLPGESTQINVLLALKDGTTATPDYSQLSVEEADPYGYVTLEGNNLILGEDASAASSYTCYLKGYGLSTVFIVGAV